MASEGAGSSGTGGGSFCATRTARAGRAGLAVAGVVPAIVNASANSEQARLVSGLSFIGSYIPS
jgi:hypothetical protein